jgi:hypothetical protein
MGAARDRAPQTCTPPDGVYCTADVEHRRNRSRLPLRGAKARRPGTVSRFEDTWDSTGARPECYDVRGYVQYESAASPVSVLTLHAGRVVFVPAVWKRSRGPWSCV